MHEAFRNGLSKATEGQRLLLKTKRPCVCRVEATATVCLKAGSRVRLHVTCSPGHSSSRRGCYTAVLDDIHGCVPSLVSRMMFCDTVPSWRSCLPVCNGGDTYPA
jgi:hypothetical protein